MVKKKSPNTRKGRTNIPLDVRVAVLTESGYRCAVPTCRMILALDLHHLHEVALGGGNSIGNLIALCPNCHSLFHRGTIRRESLYAYKSMLVALARGFDIEAIDRLLFLLQNSPDFLVVSGDGLLHFSRLAAADLITVELKANNSWQIVTYAVNLSTKGRMLVEAWKSGDREELKKAIQRSTLSIP